MLLHHIIRHHLSEGLWDIDMIHGHLHNCNYIRNDAKNLVI